MVVIAFLVYFFIRGAVVDRAGEALANGLDLIALERATGMYWEIEWQSWIIDEYWAVRAMNWIYFWGHMPSSWPSPSSSGSGTALPTDSCAPPSSPRARSGS